MLKQRVITALILLPIALAVILALPTLWFAPVAGLVFLGGAWEWSALAGIRTTALRVAYIGVVAALLVLCWAIRGNGSWAFVLGLGVARAELRRYGTVPEHLSAHGLDARTLRGRIDGFVGGGRTAARG